MQIEIRLINDFYNARQSQIKSKTTRTLTPEHSHIAYELLEKIMDKLSNSELEDWKKEPESSEDPFFSMVKKETSGTVDSTWWEEL